MPKTIVGAKLLILFSTFLGGCASIVQKPNIAFVKRVALVSVYANDRVPKRGGGGEVREWGPTFKTQIADEATEILNAEFAKIGWQVISPDKALQAPEYRNTFTKTAEPGERGFFSATGTFPLILVGDTDAAEKTLSGLARKLGVDALLSVQLDYCYSGAGLGTGEAVMTAAASVRGVDREGDLVVRMPRISECGGRRSESQSTVPLYEGDLRITRLSPEGLKKIFLEATKQATMHTISTIRSAMN